MNGAGSRISIDLIPIYMPPTHELIERLAPRLTRCFAAEVRTHRAAFDPERAFDMSRGQYSSRALLKLLLDHASAVPSKLLGVTSVDLFSPVLTYVFGEAQLRGRAAVVSWHRLRPEAYGLPSDADLVRRRLEIEAVHELGHTFGLLHCREPSCAMHASTYAEEIDFKTAELCAACRAACNAGPVSS
jgi:archaemetzincin